MSPLYAKHQDDIISGAFSRGMMADWDNDDANLLKWRAATAETGFEKTPAGSQDISEQEHFDNGVLMVAMVKAGVELAFEKTPAGSQDISEQEYFDNGVLMVAMVKAGVELAFEKMTAVGIKAESAYYESLHETPLIANTIA